MERHLHCPLVINFVVNEIGQRRHLNKALDFFTKNLQIYNFVKPLVDFYGNGIFAQDKEQIIEQHNNIQKHGKKYISPYVSDKPIMLYNDWMRKYYNGSNVFNFEFKP